MIYYQHENLIVRDMAPSDARVFFDEYTAQGWHPEEAYYHMRMREQTEGKCVALTAEYQGQPAGAVYVYFAAQEGPFKEKGWPEIVDFSVLQKYQRRGIGKGLMDAAEKIAAARSDTVCLGVGLSREYGTAQRMYVKRGYVPDGSGVWYRNEPCVQYETVCTVDDDLVLYLYKNWIDEKAHPNAGALLLVFSEGNVVK